jgi:hypothetical protein
MKTYDIELDKSHNFTSSNKQVFPISLSLCRFKYEQLEESTLE